MKKILLIFALILTLSMACLAFTACGDDTEKNEISFKTLEVNGTNVYGRVSKDKEIFEFTNEIKVSGKAKYVVALDALGMQTVVTKTVSLNEGDNIFYVIETIDDEATAVYTVVIHRNEVYEVSFDAAGIVAAETQYIEEGFFATAPTTNVTTRLGYEFLGWDFDFAKPITGDVVVKAKIEQKEEMKIFEFSSTTTSCKITGLYDKTVTEIVIPDFVTSIGSYAFENCTSLTSVTIPDSVTSIGSYAFSNCTSLTSVTIPDSVTSIGDSAFYGCHKLVEVINHSSLKITAGSSSNGYIGYYAIEVHKGESKIVIYNDYLFYTYNGINYLFGYVGEDTALVLPESYKGENYNIYRYAFYDRKDITSATIPDSVTSIGNYAFAYCDSLTSVTIENSVTSIGDYAFRGCTGLTSVTIPDSVKTIGAFAFCYCSSLTSVTIPNSVTSIGEGAFSYCYRLVEVINHSSLDITTGSYSNGNVGHYAIEVHKGESKIVNYNDYLFYTYDGVNYLIGYVGEDTALVLLESYKGENYGIYNYAFYERKDITSVTILDSVTSIGEYAFANCDSLKSVTIPDSVTSIGNNAFAWCDGLTSVTIGNGVTSIGDSAFYDCSSLTSITVSEGNKTFSSIDGNLYSKDGKILIQYAIGKTDTSFVIPDSVTSIGNNAFYDCSSLTSVVIPDGVTSIGFSAFYNCTSLTSVTIPDSVTSIGYCAFSGCTSLTSVTIGNSVTSIGSSAFYNCTSLTIYCEAASKPSGWDSWWNYSGGSVVWGYKG